MSNKPRPWDNEHIKLLHKHYSTNMFSESDDEQKLIVQGILALTSNLDAAWNYIAECELRISFLKRNIAEQNKLERITQKARERNWNPDRLSIAQYTEIYEETLREINAIARHTP